MGFLQKLFKPRKVVPEKLLPLLSSQEHKAAGVMFLNKDTHVLAGYQPNKLTPRITGIGGMKFQNESLLYTALRECIEELFHIETINIPIELITDIIKNIIPKDCYMNGSYGIVVYSFEDLVDILKLAKKYKLKTELYNKIPKTVEELIYLRKRHEKAEIQSLSIIGIENYPASSNILHKEFIYDIKEIYDRIKNNKYRFAT